MLTTMKNNNNKQIMKLSTVHVAESQKNVLKISLWQETNEEEGGKKPSKNIHQLPHSTCGILIWALKQFFSIVSYHAQAYLSTKMKMNQTAHNVYVETIRSFEQHLFVHNAASGAHTSLPLSLNFFFSLDFWQKDARNKMKGNSLSVNYKEKKRKQYIFFI